MVSVTGREPEDIKTAAGRHNPERSPIRPRRRARGIPWRLDIGRAIAGERDLVGVEFDHHVVLAIAHLPFRGGYSGTTSLRKAGRSGRLRPVIAADDQQLDLADTFEELLRVVFG